MKKITPLMLGSSLLLAASLFAHNQPSYGQSSQGQPNEYRGNNPYASAQINWLRNYSDAIAQSQASSKPIVVLFTGTSWCPACMKLEREVLTSSAFAQNVGNKFIFLKAEFPDYAEEAILSSPFRPLLERYGVDAFPTMVVINAMGQKLYTINYQAGGPEVYVRELTQTLNSNSYSSGNSFNNRR